MKPKILVVDDDENLTRLYEAALSARGYQVFVACNGEEALSVAEKEIPDLILLDVMMPNVHGLNVLDIIKATPEVQNCKVIMLSALSDEGTKEKAAKAGALSFIVKSESNMAEILEKIEKAL